MASLWVVLVRWIGDVWPNVKERCLWWRRRVEPGGDLVPCRMCRGAHGRADGLRLPDHSFSDSVDYSRNILHWARRGSASGRGTKLLQLGCNVRCPPCCVPHTLLPK